jgi:hypothetical protein
MRPIAGFLALALMLLASVEPVRAQLGSVNNPPPQNLFNDKPTPKLDNGLSSYAERRASLSRNRNGIIRHRNYPARRHVYSPR